MFQQSKVSKLIHTVCNPESIAEREKYDEAILKKVKSHPLCPEKEEEVEAFYKEIKRRGPYFDSVFASEKIKTMMSSGKQLPEKITDERTKLSNTQKYYQATPAAKPIEEDIFKLIIERRSVSSKDTRFNSLVVGKGYVLVVEKVIEELFIHGLDVAKSHSRKTVYLRDIFEETVSSLKYYPLFCNMKSYSKLFSICEKEISSTKPTEKQPVELDETGKEFETGIHKIWKTVIGEEKYRLNKEAKEGLSVLAMELCISLIRGTFVILNSEERMTIKVKHIKTLISILEQYYLSDFSELTLGLSELIPAKKGKEE